MYQVKEIYYTLQGEGARMGRPSVFCRFAGCNLWTGREEDRPSAVCNFCDTDFVGTDGPDGGRFADPRDLATAVARAWPGPRGQRIRPYVICTGGEPLLQLDGPLVDALHAEGFEIAIETNGTRLAPPGIDWICVSPKAGAELRQTAGDELKLVYPQPGLSPEHLGRLDFDHFYLSPMNGPDLRENTRAAVQYCLEHPQWHLTLQMHRLVGIR